MSISLIYVVFFFSSRRRHTRCALVTGVQTCALPICGQPAFIVPPDLVAMVDGQCHARKAIERRSEERRVGKECVSTCRSRWSPNHSKKKNRKDKLFTDKKRVIDMIRE